MIFKTLIIMLIMFFLLGVSLYDSGVTQEEFQNITNTINYDTLNSTSILREGGNNQNNTFIERFVYKYADAFLFISVEGMKSSIKFGYEHPYYNFGLIATIIMIGLFGLPLILFILFIVYGSIAIVKFFKEKKNKGGIK